ncbi:MAG: complex I subunit 5 family protein [Brevefilum sp.]
MVLPVLPAAILIAGAFMVYIVSRLLRLSNRAEALLTVLVLIGTLMAYLVIFTRLPSLMGWSEASFGIQGRGGILYRPSATGIFVLLFSTFVAILVTIYSGEYLQNVPRYLLFYPLLLLTQVGLYGIFTSKNLFNLFLLTELTTVAASALIAFRFHQEISIKAGFKYLIMSSLGTMIMLLGVYFIYQSVGDLHLVNILESPDRFTRIGAACFLVGFSLKAGVVPLHTWVPDVYGHAPSAVSGLLAGVLSKSMLLILPLISLRLGMTQVELGVFLMVFGCFNMLLGSIRMLGQTLLRRFLSFSSIAQTGYLMFGFGIGYYYELNEAFSAGLFLFLVIGLMKSLAFLSAGIYEFHAGTQDLARLQGIGQRLPWAALSFSTALASLAGIPLLAGFTGKWMVFSAALRSGDWFAGVCLAVFLVSTVIGLAGYLPLLVKQYLPLSEGDQTGEIVSISRGVSAWMLAPVMLLSIILIGIGLYPGPWINLVSYVLRWMEVI